MIHKGRRGRAARAAWLWNLLTSSCRRNRSRRFAGPNGLRTGHRCRSCMRRQNNRCFVQAQNNSAWSKDARVSSTSVGKVELAGSSSRHVVSCLREERFMTTVRTSWSPEGSLSRSFSPYPAYAVCSAAMHILQYVYNLMRPSKRAGALARTIALGLCASQLTASIAAFPRDSVPQQFASAAEPPGYQRDIRIWGDSYANYPAGRLVRLRDERLKAQPARPITRCMWTGAPPTRSSSCLPG